MRPFPRALRRAALIGLVAGLVGGLAAVLPCHVPPLSEACARPAAGAPMEIHAR